MYKFAAMTTALSGIMSAIAIVMGLFFADVVSFAVFAAAALLIASPLFKERRWAAWLAFFIMIASMIRALLGVNSGSYAPDWVFYAIAVFSAVSMMGLFVILWNSKVSAAHS